MTLLFSDAMDSHGVTANLDQTYDNVSSSGVSYLSTGGRFGDGGIQVSAILKSFDKSFAASVDIFVSFGLKIDLFAGGTTAAMVFTHIGGSISVTPDSSGNLVLQFAAGSPVASFPISAGVFHWVSMHLRIHATLGKWTVNVDGIQEVDFSGDTINVGTPDTINGIQFGAGVSAVYIWDDIIITDGLGGSFDGLLADRRIETIRPDGVGTATNFAPFPADAVNWNKVDDVTPDDDTTFVEDAVSAQRDTYTHGNMTLTPASIDGLVVKTLAKNPDGGSNDIKHVIDSNGTVSVGSAVGTTSDYLVKQTLFETDPDTAVAWVKAGVDAVEAGFEVA